METPSTFALRINKFDYIHGVISVPYESMWYRAYDASSKPIIKNTPTFFGDMEVAFFYSKGNDNRKLGEFKCKRPLYLMDIRYVMAFLPFFLTRSFENKDILKKITVALGLCSFQKQIELLDEMNESSFDENLRMSIERMKNFTELQTLPEWTNPIELRGVRIGITDIDYEVMCWLKLLLEKCVDGIIAPMMPSPFHNQHSHSVDDSVLYQELVLFSPEQVLEHSRDLPKTQNVVYYQQTGDFNQFIQHHKSITFSLQPLRYSKDAKNQRGGTSNDIKYLSFEKQKELEKELSQKKKQWVKDVKRIHKSQYFLKHTTIPLSLVDECRKRDS